MYLTEWQNGVEPGTRCSDLKSTARRSRQRCWLCKGLLNSTRDRLINYLVKLYSAEQSSFESRTELRLLQGSPSESRFYRIVAKLHGLIFRFACFHALRIIELLAFFPRLQRQGVSPLVRAKVSVNRGLRGAARPRLSWFQNRLPSTPLARLGVGASYHRLAVLFSLQLFL
ncbi:hypothetical protein EVAR_48066_1 [Eumeta japonica]|uniref:Uncharacterized protein n=1 Tax=Eumeta variegata TaxID=151549 RepID=A0A4C1X7R6_EUMVA|nr:hypothetical protein EVAR_48066_1 [Eumeta japonica]